MCIGDTAAQYCKRMGRTENCKSYSLFVFNSVFPPCRKLHPSNATAAAASAVNSKIYSPIVTYCYATIMASVRSGLQPDFLVGWQPRAAGSVYWMCQKFKFMSFHSPATNAVFFSPRTVCEMVRSFILYTRTLIDKLRINVREVIAPETRTSAKPGDFRSFWVKCAVPRRENCVGGRLKFPFGCCWVRNFCS